MPSRESIGLSAMEKVATTAAAKMNSRGTHGYSGVEKGRAVPLATSRRRKTKTVLAASP